MLEALYWRTMGVLSPIWGSWFARCWQFVHDNDLGIVLGRRDVRLARGWCESPTIVISWSDCPVASSPRGYLDLAPDLAVEIISRTTPSGNGTQMLDYLRPACGWCGTCIRPRASASLRESDKYVTLTAQDILDARRVAGFQLPLATLFASRENGLSQWDSGEWINSLARVSSPVP